MLLCTVAGISILMTIAMTTFSYKHMVLKICQDGMAFLCYGAGIVLYIFECNTC